MSNNQYAEDMEAYLRDNGFIWGPSPEAYGGFAGFYTYAPLGKAVKNKVENHFRNAFQRRGFDEVEAPLILPESVWDASGHLDSFVDPIIQCSSCDASHRADTLIENHFDINAEAMTHEDMADFIEENDVECPSCGGAFEQHITPYNLMIKCSVAQDVAYARPETATTTYLPFNRYYHWNRKQYPVKIFQIGEAFRNEISPRQNVLRGREFTQAEAQIFLPPEEKNEWNLTGIQNQELPLWTAAMQSEDKEPKRLTVADALEQDVFTSKGYAWCVHFAYTTLRALGFDEDRLRIREHDDHEKAHYAKEAWDVEIRTKSFGWTEACGVHDRTDHDLKQHGEHAQDKMVPGDTTPHILEVAFGVDRPLYALLDQSYTEEDLNGKTRTVLKIPKSLAPRDAAVFPLVDTDGLPAIAKNLHETLLEHGFNAVYDDSGSSGKRYRRQDENGTPYCITVDYDSRDDNQVTVRDRDSMEQERIPIEDVPTWIREHRG
jgi:glycyl-tRNA synthetase